MDVFSKNPRVKLAVNKSLLKEYTKNNNRVVYMEDGQEFQIQLFNPYTYTIGAEITINDERQNAKVVIRPGERIWLDRYIDVSKKLKVSTYEVDSNDAEVNNAIKYNGRIQVAFYKERQRSEYPALIKTIHEEPFKLPGDNINKTGTAPWPNNGTITWTNTVLGRTDSITAEPAVHAYYCSTDLLGSSAVENAGSFVTSATANCDFSASFGESSFSQTSFSQTVGKKETARIDHGSHSNQEFVDVDLDFNFYSFDTETIYIYPMSRKPFTSADANKRYCWNCGKRLSPKFRFCPTCGAAQ